MKLGYIADDFTGATDLANNLVRSGMRVVQTIGVPPGALSGAAAEADAVVVALKSRTIPAAEAVAQSLAALQWLRARGAQQVYFKYCSTFDSTPAGNIGPVAEALMDALGTDFTVATPAFPDNGRTVFKGHLFVGERLLNESGMQHHPLTPMTDPDLVRVLQAQCQRRVGLIDHRVLAGGVVAVRARIDTLRAEGVGLAIVDAVSNRDLLCLGAALAGQALVTGGSGVAIGLPPNWGFQPDDRAARLPPPQGLQAVVSGSCSAATRRQVQVFIEAGGPALSLDPLALVTGAGIEGWVQQALAWAAPRLAQGPVLVYATAEPAAVQAVQQRLGTATAGALVEQALAAVAVGLVGLGVRQLVVAGGETSGGCVQALGLSQLQIGPQIAPGVPWCHAASPATTDGLHLTLKSGNFGGERFFADAFEALR
jgi:uncharacterized protein YgbK (DUF1537 family)